MIRLLLLLLISSCSAYLNIEDFGAKPDRYVIYENSKAIEDAFEYGNLINDKTILIPDKTYFISAIDIRNMDGMTLIVNGVLKASNLITPWPKDNENKRKKILNFYNMNNFTITSDCIVSTLTSIHHRCIRSIAY